MRWSVLPLILVGVPTACVDGASKETTSCPTADEAASADVVEADGVFSEALYFPESDEFVGLFAEVVAPVGWVGDVTVWASEDAILVPALSTETRCLLDLSWWAVWGPDLEQNDIDIYGGRLRLTIAPDGAASCGTMTLQDAMFHRPTDGSVILLDEITGSLSCLDGYWGEPVADR